MKHDTGHQPAGSNEAARDATTPETDAVAWKHEGAGSEYAELFRHARKLERQRDELLAAIQPILAEYAKRDPIGDSDLYDEQPVHITVTLGDLRRLLGAARGLAG